MTAVPPPAFLEAPVIIKLDDHFFSVESDGPATFSSKNTPVQFLIVTYLGTGEIIAAMAKQDDSGRLLLRAPGFRGDLEQLFFLITGHHPSNEPFAFVKGEELTA